MIPQCSPFLRCHGVLAKKKSMKHLDALLLPTRQFSLVLLATSLSSMTQKRHIKMQMAGRQRECNDFQWGSKAIVRGNLVGTACSRCDAKAVGVDAPTSEHFLTTTSHNPPPNAYTHLDQQKAAFWGGTIPGKTEGGVHLFQSNMVKNLMCSLQNPIRTVWVLMGNRSPVIKKDMTGFCFVWMQGKKSRFSVSQTIW